jgi:predicted aminopeptidase
MKVLSRRNPKAVFGLLLTLALCGCESVNYYGQAVNGQYHILQSRQPIADIIADPNTPEILEQRLKLILAVREFAGTELQLPVGNHYLSYVDLDRPVVAWNIFAAPEFSLTPKTWCYPIAGCAAYRGYFDLQDARQYSQKLKAQGYDVYVGGVTAYSTLGWFDDPVFSTFSNLSDAQTAALIFHELAHQKLFVPGDTAFNESFATAVEQEGLRRWQIASKDALIYDEYLRTRQRHEAFVQLVMKYRRRLEAMYAGELSLEAKRGAKAQIISDLTTEYHQLKSARPDLAVYANWFNYPINNAQIISITTYNDFVPAFIKLLQQHDRNLQQFYDACQSLAQKEESERHAILKEYAEEVVAYK